MGLFSRKQFNVYDELPYDIRNLNKEEFMFLDEETNSNGTKYSIFVKYLDKPFLGFFNRIEFFEFPDGSRNVFIKGLLSDKMDIGEFVVFINKLYENFGEDDMGSGRFDEYNEAREIGNLLWAGRMWMNTVPKITISLYGAEFSIYVYN